MKAPRRCCRRDCNDEGASYTADGDFLCSDHLQDWQDEQILFPRRREDDERREEFMRLARST